jgi:hypothetical protein
LDDTNVHSDTDTLLARLTSARATLLDNLSNLDAAISSRNATEPDNTSIAAILEDTGTTLPSQIESATDEIVGSDGDTLETLSDQIDGTVTMGAGSNAVTITVTDGSNPIESVAVWITTDVGGSSVVAGTLYTDANGQVTFYLDNGSYYVWQQLAGYNFTTPESITVAG